jgi:hypothetical protein
VTDEEGGMERWDWQRMGRVLAWTTAISFFAGALIVVLQQFGVTGPQEPNRLPPDLVDRILQFFRDESAAWPLDLASRLLFMVGFVGVIGLGLVARRFVGRDDPRTTMAAGSFALAGGLGIVAELVTIGVKQVAIDPTYCQCKYAPEQVISRWQTLGQVETAEEWLFYGGFLLWAVGIYLLSRVALERGMFSRGWAYLGYVIAALFIVGIVSAAFDLELLFNLTVALGAGVLIPVWVVWLARRLPREVPAAPPIA